MNILIPDEWLRQHLKTKATPKQLKDYLSLCGPSIERVNDVGGQIVYDIEVTTNRIDMMSVRGIAREAAVILPEFGIAAELLPFTSETEKLITPKTKLDIEFKNNADLCYRLLALKISDITLQDSPPWLKKRLELVGQRPLNNMIDITNYVMWEVGHPIHVFDYDRLTEKKIIVRLAKKGEKLKTLDEKTHTLLGGEIIFDDGTGEIVDLPGIMGTANTVVTNETKNVLIFLENSDPVKIRKASMGLSIRTQAAVLNEKHPDPELALVAMKRAVELTKELTGGTIASELKDIYPHKPVATTIAVSGPLLDQYIGEQVEDKRVKTILERLGCTVKISHGKQTVNFEVVPSSLRIDDLQIPEDIVEEVARIVGYHTIKPRLPSREPPMVIPDPQLMQEEEIKRRLRDWGYTEIYGYSMLDAEDLTHFSLDSKNVYAITNPLSSDHVFLRPSLLVSMLNIIRENLSNRDSLSLFELSNTYQKNDKNLPHEQSELLVAVTDDNFLKVKGIAEALFTILGIPFPNSTKHPNETYFEPSHSLQIGEYGAVGLINTDLLEAYGIKPPVTILSLSVAQLVKHANPNPSYKPIPKHPPIIEDFSFIFPEQQFIGPVLEVIQTIDPRIYTVSLLDAYENKRTVRVNYLDPEKTLTVEEIKPLREKIINSIQKQFNATLQGNE